MSMKIVIAPDKFRGCLSALEAAQAIEQGVRRVLPDATIDLVPMADGGEGLVDALMDAIPCSSHHVEVTGPLGDRVRARFARVDGSGRTVMEMASASGLVLVPPGRRDPSMTTTFGTGELLLKSITLPDQSVILGIGGSGTNDGGAGLAQALGYRLLDVAGRSLPPGGAALGQLDRTDASGRAKVLDHVTIRVGCDVDNPLCGPLGASAVYGPQKGADPAMVAMLDRNLVHFARIIQRDLGVDVAEVPGAGAAGGLGAGLIAFAGATLVSGIELVIEATGLRQRLIGADLCITGEGRIDASSAHGKTVVGIGREAQRLAIPTLAICGSIGPGAEAVLDQGIAAYFSICPQPMTLETALDLAAHLLTNATEQMVRGFLAGRKQRDHG